MKQRNPNRIRAAGGDSSRGHMTRLYAIYGGILSRCNNPNRPKYKNYGARGIRCEFQSYLEFKEWALSNGYEETLTIERLNVNGNYSKGNCTWIPAEQQKYNKTSNKVCNIRPSELMPLIEEARLKYGEVTKLAKKLDCCIQTLYKYYHQHKGGYNE